MKRLRLTTAAALASFGLLCGCATNTNMCGERQGFFSRWFGGNRAAPCECVETGRVTVSDGPVVPEPSVGVPSFPGPNVGEPSYPITAPTLPAPVPSMPNASPLAQPIPAGPASQVKDVKK